MTIYDATMLRDARSCLEFFRARHRLGLVKLGLREEPLDGGRALFILLEGILGKKRRAKLEFYTNQAGMVFFLALIVLISIKDVFAIFAGK